MKYSRLRKIFVDAVSTPRRQAARAFALAVPRRPESLLYDFFHRRPELSHGRLSHRMLLRYPEHRFAQCGWAKTEMRVARDGHVYTFHDFEEEHGKWATWYWKRSTVLNPVSNGRYNWFRYQEKQTCHRAMSCSCILSQASSLATSGGPESLQEDSHACNAIETCEQRRLRKRLAAVTHVKSLTAYQLVFITRDVRSAEDEPLTPDCTNLSTSKRCWESRVLTWRWNIERLAEKVLTDET